MVQTISRPRGAREVGVEVHGEDDDVLLHEGVWESVGGWDGFVLWQNRGHFGVGGGEGAGAGWDRLGGRGRRGLREWSRCGYVDGAT